MIAFCNLGCIVILVVCTGYTDILLYWVYMYMAMYCLCWKLVYLASCDCIIHVYWGIYTVYFVYYVLWLHLAVYRCILFVSPTCSSDGGSGAGTFLCLSPSSRSAYGISSFKAPNNPGPFWYKKIESHYCAVDSWHI